MGLLVLLATILLIGMVLEQESISEIRRSVQMASADTYTFLQQQKDIASQHTQEKHHHTEFQQAANEMYQFVVDEAGVSCDRNNNSIAASTTNDQKCIPRKRLDIATFSLKAQGGLLDEDREYLAELYYQSESVFEFGVGESTDIATATNVPRYVGVDSSSEWITQVRQRAPNRFRFQFCDIGETGAWGFPRQSPPTAKAKYNYQVAPLLLEKKPFDVYLVDGRFRVSCVVASFLHALSTGGDLNKTRVLLHDYGYHPRMRNYSIVETVANTQQKGKFLVMSLKHNAMDAQLHDIWKVRERIWVMDMLLLGFLERLLLISLCLFVSQQYSGIAA